MKEEMFSHKLEKFIKSKKSMTVHDLDGLFAEKSFAIGVLLMMLIPALPIPTGGLTHVFEIIAIILAVELLIGRKNIWLPEKLKKQQLNSKALKGGLKTTLKFIRFFERFSRQRMSGFVKSRVGQQLYALSVIVLALAAFVAPPFSGLDTLPSLGAVILSLAIIFDDIVVFIAGLIIGSGGIALILALAKTIYHGLSNILGIN